MKLSEAIILGSTMYKQAFGAFERSDHSRCAWAGAMGACSLPTHLASWDYSFPLEWVWTRTTTRCPECPKACRLPVCDMVLHLNDDHEWQAAKIGAWVRSIEPQDFIQDLTQSIKQNADKFTECECCEALSEKAKGYWTEGHFYCELCSPAIREQEISIGNEHSDYQHGLGVKA